MKTGEQLSKAILIATLAHDGQYDKGGKPYIMHPLAVLYLLKSDDEDDQVAAVLHDVLEDKSGKTIYIGGVPKVISYKMLKEEGISETSLDTLRRVTKVPGQTEDEYEIEVMGSIRSIKVKMADLEHNSDIKRMKGVSEKDIARMVKYQCFYFKLAHRLNDIVNGKLHHGVV